MSATLTEITNLINEGYIVKIGKPNADVVSVNIKARDGRLVSSGCQRTLDDAMTDAYMGTPEVEAVIAGVMAQVMRERDEEQEK